MIITDDVRLPTTSDTGSRTQELVIVTSVDWFTATEESHRWPVLYNGNNRCEAAKRHD